ncbi:urease accessory protein UreF [Planobispora rosea]|uniref:Urease accessory protein UreF n=1 Tax=Planobispora rosea TaxID=35762 RepID=A0A8J3RWW0_PLARO|nr:urease accessory UreF family protein [Planobispora rosea]GGS47814.1 urease accessory protein UreF [Planobispora rosea]GIH82165.1 urease accessory protein UreF [Planobispora rosea]
MSAPSLNAALLLLADSRLPAGGHGHSGGAEAAIAAGAVRDLPTLAAFLRGRLATSGLVAACLAASACALAASSAGSGTAGDPAGAPPGGWAELDAEAGARTASPAQREASRVQGRLLLRTARRIWPSPVLDGLARAVPEGAHHPVALGAAAGVAGCAPGEAALAAAYAAVTGPATAAVRLLGLDPVAVHRLLADLAPDLERAASTGSGAAASPASVPPPRTAASVWAELPAHSAPALDLLAERHLRAGLRLFVS